MPRSPCYQILLATLATLNIARGVEGVGGDGHKLVEGCSEITHPAVELRNLDHDGVVARLCGFEVVHRTPTSSTHPTLSYLARAHHARRCLRAPAAGPCQRSGGGCSLPEECPHRTVAIIMRAFSPEQSHCKRTSGRRVFLTFFAAGLAGRPRFFLRCPSPGAIQRVMDVLKWPVASHAPT